MAEVARREGIWREDGTLGEHVHGPGAVTLDAADLVAPALGASHAQAQRRVEQAVRLAAGRAPVEADRGEVAPLSGLGALHDAMADGSLDGYRAGVVAYELEGVPAEVADAVVAALTGHLAEDGSRLRLRARRLLTRISPDLLRQRTERARASTGLRRWVAEPGVDAWFGTFPSEDAATAWAAVDRLAHQYVADGTCSSVEQARGRALTDLVTGNATVDVQVVVTVPADACTTGAACGSSEAGHSEPGGGACATGTTSGSFAVGQSAPGGDACTTDVAPGSFAAGRSARGPTSARPVPTRSRRAPRDATTWSRCRASGRRNRCSCGAPGSSATWPRPRSAPSDAGVRSRPPALRAVRPPHRGASRRR